jgi:arabinofuranosyltransferase
MRPSTSKWAVRAALLLALAAAAVFGASRLAFLCDDAFITFRYVSNAMDGHGLVWNAPPFRPVEGYTGFLWAMLLWGVWAVLGIEPPAAANPLSIAFGLMTLGAVALAAFRLRDRRGELQPDFVVFGTLAVLVGNRTFLQWLTGGLETALFNAAFVGWVLLAFRARSGRGTGWLLAWSGLASIAALTRPDGLLLAVVTGTVAAAALRRGGLAAMLRGSSPLLVVLAHVLWRVFFYGEWLPNTYYAKVTAPWPEAGVRYLYCFVFEHGLWVWGAVALAWLAVSLRRGRLGLGVLAVERLPAVAAVAATLFQVGYYVVRVGGDHFEYRVLSHLVPLAVISLAAMAGSLSVRALVPMAALGCLALAGSVGWLHLALTRPVQAPQFDTLTAKLPAWAQPFTRTFDRCQVWLQLQFNCVRCAAHQETFDGFVAALPARARMPVDPADLPVCQAKAVGLAGWVLPDTAMLDLLGLNDWVTARTPTHEWNAFYLPQEALRAALAQADSNGDGICSRAELVHSFTAAPGFTPPTAAGFVDIMLFLFARAADGQLTIAETADVESFVANLRWIAHERHAPPEYVAAFDPNVTIENRAVVVRKRAVPLTAERVRAVEAEWRQKVRNMPGR